MPELELYVHIPFCVRKCAYCDFLSAPAGRKKRDRYVNTLIEEIRGGQPVSAPDREFWGVPFSGHAKGRKGQKAGSSLQGELSDENPYLVTSVFFGGGTPSILPPTQIAKILEALQSTFLFSGREDNCGIPEITIECNPGAIGDAGTFEAHEFHRYLACGINRISFGLQSADNRELAALGRIHTWETFLHSYRAAREAGFSNINIDLMSALPGQTLKSWESTLRQILKLAPEHISAYSLIIEEGTPFYEKYHADDLVRSEGDLPQYLPSEEEERQMVRMTEQMLSEAGYEHYEISNYARPGYACRHNIGYWRGTEYMGFGLGASSLLRNPQDSCFGTKKFRCKNPADHIRYEQSVLSRKSSGGKEGRTNERQLSFVKSYEAEQPDKLSAKPGEAEQPDKLSAKPGEAEQPDKLSVKPDTADELEVLSLEDEMAEFMFLGLRMLSGVSTEEFHDRFGRPIEEVYGDVIRRMVSLELMECTDGRIFLTPKGLDVSNPVMAEFLL